MSARYLAAAPTLLLLSTTTLLALGLITALLWFGLPWLVLGLILAPLGLILSLA
jgi:hypothetical protein